MNITRRQLLKITLAGGATGLAYAAGLLRPLTTRADWPNTAFAVKTEQDALAILYGDEEITSSDAIKIVVHDLVENGAVVPVKVTAETKNVESITILVEKNPYPLIASFELGPDSEGYVATRIKMGESSDIITVVRANGKLYSARKFVEVTEGGCGE
ncbi:MAG: thiosulfate oxidation carrier protein SoxY [Gammaproteobacteria bacterium]|nr:thiosulfate oxidation carrier protein SoxY [Gammaproteobacteria bacterium]